MHAAVDAKANRLIGALPDADCRRWQQSLESVDLPLGQVVYEFRCRLESSFPTTAIVSLLYVMKNGAAAEIDRGSRR